MVIGYPLSHTLSPVLHNTVYQHAHIDAILMAFPIENVENLFSLIKLLSVGFVAVTMPFKEKILPFLDESSEEVLALKAANTIICNGGKLVGYNTDVDGIAYALRNIPLHSKNVLLLGAGGAARAAAYFLKKNHAHLFWYHRSHEKILQLQSEFGGEIIDAPHAFKDTMQLIVNATPQGMFPEVDLHPLPHFNFSSKMVVFDMVYNPKETLLLKTAKKQGAKIVSGLDMFIGQGIRQIELWTKKALFEKEMMTKIKLAIEKALL